MRRPWTILLCTVLLAGPALASQPRSITVDGQGSVSAVPDMAEIAVAVTARADEPVEATDTLATRMRAVLTALDEAGIAGADRQTRHLALRPVHSRDERGGEIRIEGYEARQGLSITVRDLDAVGTVLDALISAGADEIGGIAFDTSERDALREEARRAAVADARRSAALLAEAAGVALGPVQSIALMRDHGGPRLAMRAMADEAMPVAAGEITVTAEVQAVFAIE